MEVMFEDFQSVGRVPDLSERLKRVEKGCAIHGPLVTDGLGYHLDHWIYQWFNLSSDCMLRSLEWNFIYTIIYYLLYFISCRYKEKWQLLHVFLVLYLSLMGKEYQ